MLAWSEYTKLLLALLVIINPVGAIPLFVGLSAQNSEQEKKHIARVASIAAGVVLLIAALGGQAVLAFFGITISSFKVGGAILIMLVAIAMMQATPSKEKQTPEEALEAVGKESISVVPLAIPLLSGPGAISTTIIFAAKGTSITHAISIGVCCLLAAVITWVALSIAAPASRWLGTTGMNIAMRLMGLLLAAVSVEIFVSGLVGLFPGLN